MHWRFHTGKKSIHVKGYNSICLLAGGNHSNLACMVLSITPVRSISLQHSKWYKTLVAGMRGFCIFHAPAASFFLQPWGGAHLLEDPPIVDAQKSDRSIFHVSRAMMELPTYVSRTVANSDLHTQKRSPTCRVRSKESPQWRY